jgi:hypothetical protein
MVTNEKEVVWLRLWTRCIYGVGDGNQHSDNVDKGGHGEGASELYGAAADILYGRYSGMQWSIRCVEHASKYEHERGHVAQ